MTPQERNHLDAALVEVYRRKGITYDNRSLFEADGFTYRPMPTRKDMLEVLSENSDAKNLALVESRFVTGSAKRLGQATNVDLDNQFVVIDTLEIGKDLLAAGTFTATDFCTEKCKESRVKKKALILDELWALIGASSNPQAAEFVLECFKTYRAFGAAVIGATQDLNDFFALENGKFGRAILWFSGYKFKRDPRDFDILPDATHGTSGWMDRKEMEQVVDLGSTAEMQGILLGKLKDDPDDDDKYSEYVAPSPKNHLNSHIIIYGASGSGKTRGIIKPFIMQAIKRGERLVYVDPKGELFESTSQYARDNGAVVKAFNLLDKENSDGINFLAGIEEDNTLIQTIAETIIKNTSNANERQDFWEKAELNLLCALLHYVQRQEDPRTHQALPIEQRAIGDIYKILSTESITDLETRFADLPKGHPALAPYGLFKQANRQIWGNIAIGLGNRLSVFQDELIDKITRYNDIDLLLPGQRPCVYYCIISAQDSSLEFFSSLLFSLMFTRLPNYARKNYPNGRLPIPVNFVLDEFCNVGYLGDFKKTISVCRSFNLNCQLATQGIAQLSDRYPNKEWEEIIGNCDTQLFLGCNDQITAEYISDKCGQVTIRTTNGTMPLQPLFSPIFNSTRPYSQSRSNTQRPLMLPDELLRLDNSQEIVLFRGHKPLQLYKITPEELPDFEKLQPLTREERSYPVREPMQDRPPHPQREELPVYTPMRLIREDSGPPLTHPPRPKPQAQPPASTRREESPVAPPQAPPPQTETPPAPSGGLLLKKTRDEISVEELLGGP